MTDFDNTLGIAEKSRERLAAIIRVFVFLALLAAVLSLREHGAHHHPVLNVTIAYGLLAAAGVVFAWRGVFHPLLPFVFVTLEVGLVAVQTVLMGSLMGQPPMSLAALPVATVIFVILAHAAMRYRPWLVLYAAGLFLVLLTVAGLAMPGPNNVPAATRDLPHDMVHHDLFPALMVILSSGILFVTALGTRQLLHSSVAERLARHRLSRFFAPDIAKQLTDPDDDASARGAVQPVAVLFADIRGFSSLAESLPPHELSELLGEFREILAHEIRDHGGVVDKFIGDAVLAVFGFPASENVPARRSLDCAFSILGKLDRWADECRARGRPAVTIGIGVHFGEAFVGVVGKESLLEFTVIGDTVNIAERIERLTRTFDAEIVISEALAEAAGLDRPAARWSSMRDCELAGHAQRIDILHLRRTAPTEAGQAG